VTDYRTRDLGLAAFLMLRGLDPLRTVEEAGSVWFVFDDAAREVKGAWFGSRASRFYANVKRAKRMVGDARR
jgi:hypothetical protein